MPWMAVEKDYRFEGPDGQASLLDLFERRRQLVVYRAFYVRMSPRTRKLVAPTRSGPVWAAPSAQTRLRTLPT